ncbi:MAG TPA: APC family permease [Candidatus Acidoferrum sp.]|nr:APC family permease [Candidatus Acidoferrum sp.]
MNILDLLVGKPLATNEERAEQIGPGRGIPIFGLDALSSAAYGPEAALSLLIPLGLVGLRYVLPLSTAIIVLLVIVFFSYRQTIEAYPNGGGSYTVARSNLGALPGLLAAAALLTDYILTAAVGISAGVGALVSAVPQLHSHMVGLCVGILIIITILNLRGLREAGLAFMFPTYLFVGTLGITIAAGIFRVFASGGHPAPLAAMPAPPAAVEAVSIWLLLKAFSSGCAALTGVEAVSNGVKAFRDPGVKNAQRTLTIVILILAVLLAGISYLAKSYGITATDPSKAGYQSLLSLIVMAVFGRGAFYYVTIASILLVLSLSANTAFADFPRLCRSIALDNYLPHVFAFRGRRLVYTYGIIILAVLTGALLVLFGGITDRLIPLYAVGAFLAFTLSQFGMVAHWRKKRGPHWVKSAFVNGLGGFVTGITVLVILVAKFVEGAWITILFIPMLILIFSAVRRHYHSVSLITRCTLPMVPACHSSKPIAVVPVDHYSQITRHGLELASRLTTDVIAVHVQPDEHSEVLSKEWERFVVKPFEDAGDPPPKLVRLPSPYRFVIVPIVQYILQLAARQPERRIVVVIPELAEGKWYEYFLHNQRGRLLSWLLLVKGNERIFTLNAPYYLGHHSPAHKSATTTADADAAINTMVEQSKSTNPTTS